MGGSLNPMALLMGGGSFFTLSAMIWGLKVSAWLRYPGIALCVALGLTCFTIAILRGFHKKPERPRYTSKKAPPVELLPEVKARASSKPPSTAGARSAKPRRTPPPGAV
jgi:hypothetical protein